MFTSLDTVLNCIIFKIVSRLLLPVTIVTDCALSLIQIQYSLSFFNQETPHYVFFENYANVFS